MPGLAAGNRGSLPILTLPQDAIPSRPQPLEAGTLRLGGIGHGYFTRNGGVSTGIYASLNTGLGSSDAADAVAANRLCIAAVLGVDADRLATMHQVHSAEVATVAAVPDARPRVDGMVSATPGLALAVLTADCAPILFADPDARVVGVAHAGWRGATSGVIEATVAAMVALGARRDAVRAAIGPTIAQASYEVGADFAEAVLAAAPDAADLFVPSVNAGRQMFDLPGFVARRLQAAGICHIEDLAHDTYGDAARFYSYRRSCHRGEGDYGRLMSAIVLRD